MEPVDGFLPGVVAGMRLPCHYHLKRVLTRKRGQPAGILEKQQPTLIAGHSASKAEDRDVGIKIYPDRGSDQIDEVQLGVPMALPYRVFRQLEGPNEDLGLVLPWRKILVVEPRKGRMCPRPNMHTI